MVLMFYTPELAVSGSETYTTSQTLYASGCLLPDEREELQTNGPLKYFPAQHLRPKDPSAAARAYFMRGQPCARPLRSPCAHVRDPHKRTERKP